MRWYIQNINNCSTLERQEIPPVYETTKIIYESVYGIPESL